MLLSLARDTFQERKKNLLLWGAGLALTLAITLIFWPNDFLVDLAGEVNGSPTLDGEFTGWAGIAKFGHIFLYPLFVCVFAIFEGSFLLAGKTAVGHLTLLMAYPLRRWQILAARMIYLLGGVMVMTLAANLVGMIAALLHHLPFNYLADVGQWLKFLFLSADFALLAALLAALTARPWVGLLGGAGFLAGTLGVYLAALLAPNLNQLAWASLVYYFLPMPPLGTPAVWLQGLVLLGSGVLLAVGLTRVFDQLDFE